MVMVLLNKCSTLLKASVQSPLLFFPSTTHGMGVEDGNDIVGLGVFRPVRRACLEQDLNTPRCFKCFETLELLKELFLYTSPATQGF